MGQLVLLVEDDVQLVKFLRATLVGHGFKLLETASVKEGLHLLASHRPAVVLLDLGLPDGDGMDFVRQARDTSATPILVISARGNEDDKVAALDAGANDYLTKPFGVGELLARIRAALRAIGQETPASAPYVFGDVSVDLGKHVVTRAGVEVHLTPNEFKLLAVLVRHAGGVLTHRQLLKEVWGPSFMSQPQYLRVFMGQLRRKLDTDPARPQWLLTEPGVGYRLRSEA